MGKILEVITAEELHKGGEIEEWELGLPQFNGKTILRFGSPQEAYAFGEAFIKECVIPTYGVQGISNFPMAKSGPSRDASEAIPEVFGVSRPKPNQEIWLVVPTKRFCEIEGFVMQYNAREG